MKQPYTLASLASRDDLYPTEKIICHSKADGKLVDNHWSDFCVQRDRWVEYIQTKSDSKIALYSASAFEFICALAALWLCNKTAVIPGNNNLETTRQLQQQCSLFIGDFPHTVSITAPPNSSNLTDRPTIANKAINGSDTALTIFTSGSSGQPQPIEKSFNQLDAELMALNQLWGQQGNITVTGTVTHQHIYGLLFRLLWPLTAGQIFVDRTRDYCESLRNDTDNYGDIIAVMSPAHLSNLPANLCTEHLQKHCKKVFSSGAPLLEKAAIDSNKILGCDVIEVYGSSETGGIAYRQQLQNNLWQTLPKVRVKAHRTASDTLLSIQSPHLANSEWFISADRVQDCSKSGFILGSRSDRIAKIGAKRISLTAIENSLCQHPWVKQARVISLQQRSNRSAALIVLNSEGNNQLINTGKRLLNNTLAEQLNGCIDRIAIPRYWRYWDSIPCNQQGKTTHAEIAALFDDSHKPQYPILLATTGGDIEKELEIFIPHNLSWFDGHFPGRPVLPGVVQTHWANYYGQKFFGSLGSFSQLETIKFQQVINPGKHLQLNLKWNPEKSKLSFSYRQGEARLSSGRIAFNKVDSPIEGEA